MSEEARPPAVRRVLLVAAAVLIPIVVGSVATLVLYATRANPAPAQHASAATDTQIHDGQILIIQPRSANRITVPIGQVFEIILQSGAGQNVVSDNATTLMPIPTPPCHIFAICEIPGADTWAFQAVKAGAVHLRITFGVFTCPASASCQQLPRSPELLIKPVAIYARPQNS